MTAAAKAAIITAPKLLTSPWQSHQNAQVHDRLLSTGQKGQTADIPEDGGIPGYMLPVDPQVGEAKQRIEQNPETGDVLRDDSSARGAFYTPMKD